MISLTGGIRRSSFDPLSDARQRGQEEASNPESFERRTVEQMIHRSKARANFRNNGNAVAILFFLIVISLRGLSVSAQGTAEIVGIVKDTTGAVLPGVALTITNRGSGQIRQQTTDGSGGYVVTAL